MLLILILLPLLAACIGYFPGRRSEKTYYYTALLTCLLEFLASLAAAFLPAKEIALQGIASCGIMMENDGFRKVYCIIIAFMWLLTMALSKDYFEGHHKLARYFFFNLMTLSATMGVFLSADLFTALFFFEVMSFTSFPWVIQEETDGAIRAANTYLAVAVIGGLTALMGIFLLQWQLGTTKISLLYELAETCENKKILYIAGACILFGFGAKAGMFPVHIWLPKAHPVAPAPASALLSGVLTKSGIFGILAISCNIFREDPAWGTVILTLGVITMFLGALLAMFSVDLKRTLACSSMSQIGFILIGIGCSCLLGEENALAARGALLHMVNHSLFKLLLFMCAGVVYMNAHTLDLNRLKGFGRDKTLLKICFLLGAAGISGIPGLNGYISKTLLHEGIVEASAVYGPLLKVVEWIFLISGGMTLSYMTKLYVCIFAEKPDPSEEPVHCRKPYMSILSRIALILSASVLPVLGLLANRVMNRIADIGTDFLHGARPEHAVHYFSFENLKGGLISIVIGTLLYLFVIRKLLMKDGKYLNRWPGKLDLEDRIYRPVLLDILPFTFGHAASVFGENKLTRPAFHGILRLSGAASSLFGENKLTRPAFHGILRLSGAASSLFGENTVTGPVYRASVRVSGILSRTVSDLLDAFVLLLRKTVYRDSPVKNEEESAPSFRRRLLNLIRHDTHDLIDTMSFALFMLVLAICAVLIYVLAVHG